MKKMEQKSADREMLIKSIYEATIRGNKEYFVGFNVIPRKELEENIDMNYVEELYTVIGKISYQTETTAYNNHNIDRSTSTLYSSIPYKQ